MDEQPTGLVCGPRRVSHAALAVRARQVAGGLHDLGVGTGDCVAILMRNDIAFLETSLAAMMLGAYAVPINWHFAVEEIDYIVRDCGAKALVGHADLLAPVDRVLPEAVPVFAVPTPPEVAIAYALTPVASDAIARAQDYERWLAAQAPFDGAPRPAPVSMIYTSGTTGRPKGVRRRAPDAIEQAAMERAREHVFGIRPGIRALVPGPLYHSAPNAFAIRASRVCETMVLMARFEAEAFLALVERERIDTVFMVPTMFFRLLRLPQATRAACDLASLRFVVHAAAPCPPEVKRAMIDWWGPVIHEFYGSTESGAVTLATSADAIRKPGTVGRVVPGAEIRILGEDGRVLAPGETGEIFTRLPFLPDFTYHGKPGQRAEIERDGFITSGDVGYLDADGYLFVCDRKRDMVISGGVNIYPAEIEAVLASLPGVKDCAVFGIPDAEFGEALMAVVEVLPEARLSIEAIRRHLAARLAGYKVPRLIEIGRDLPREDSGKIFKRRLRDAYWADTGRNI